MINPDKQQVFELSDYFHQLGNAFGAFIEDNKHNLTSDERNELFDKQIALLQTSGEINIIGVSLVFKDVQEAAAQLDAITSAVKKTIKKALTVQVVADLASAAADIGTAIILKDPELIFKSTRKLKDLLSDIKDKKM